MIIDAATADSSEESSDTTGLEVLTTTPLSK